MKRFVILICIMTTSIIFSFSQTWNFEWEKTFGDRPHSVFIDITEAEEGGYIILGSSENNNVSAPFLIKINDFGELVWEKVFTSGENLIPKCIAKNGSSGYILAGIINAEQSEEKIFAIKTDLSGNETWKKQFISEGHCIEGKLIPLKNSNFLLAGTVLQADGNQVQKLIKVDSLGNSIWEKSISDEEQVCCRSVKELPDGTIALAQETVEKGKNNSDIQVTRIDETGEIVHVTRIPGKNTKSWPECICCSDDNCLIVVGWHGSAFNDINSENPIIDFDLFLGKIDQNGKLLWSKTIDSEGSEGGNFVTFNSDGSILVAGKKETSFSGNVGPWILNLNNDGKIINDLLIPFHFHNDQAAKIINTPDGGFVVIGPGLQNDVNPRAFAWVMKYASL